MTEPVADLLIENAVLFGAPDRADDDRAATALLLSGGRIAAIGDDALAQAGDAQRIDAEGRLVTPGLIDCHTHLVYAGNRSQEFARRLAGESYESIARAGGGILATVRNVRAASEADLVRESLPRLAALAAEGVTTVEIKSGYGLSLESERTMLRAALRLGREGGASVTTTFLGAHARPPEYDDNAAYAGHVADVMLPALFEEDLVDAVDAFCEGIGFSPDQVARIFDKAAELGLPVKLHAEQLSDQGGAALAARYNALSADHLEHVSAEGIAAMAKAGTVAVLLPGAFYTMRETRKPPVEALREAGVPIAVATDCNPGTSPIASPLTVMNMAVILFGLSPDEALAGMTEVAARALGRSDIGTLSLGARADVAIWNVASPDELVLNIGAGRLQTRIHEGRPT